MEEDEEEGKTCLITIGKTPPVPEAWEFEVPEDETAYEQKGKVIEKEGAEFYCTGEVGVEAGILIMSDYWGFNSGRVRCIADHLALSVNAQVAIPKLLAEPPLEGGTDGDGLPPDYDLQADPPAMKKWLMLYLREIFESKILTVAQHLRQSGVKRIGGVGFGFGAWIICHATVLCKDMLGAVIAYPLANELEDMNGGDTAVMASRVLCPFLFMPTSTCDAAYKPGGELYNAVKGRHEFTDYEPFLDMPHGWLTRGDASNPGIRAGIANGTMLLQKYLRHRIWPLPIGADADALRQACQDGDADMIEELIQLQIPVCGKDAYDVCGMSPIHYAARFGNVQPIKLLVAAQADVNAAGGALNETPLHCAAMQGRNKASAILLQLKANVKATDKGLQSALHHASQKGHIGVVKVLLNANACIEETDTGGQTSMHLAAWKSQQDVVRLFIALKAEIDTEDLRGQKPYDRAIQAGATECSDQLDIEREKRELEAFHRQEAENAQKAEEEAKSAAEAARAAAAAGEAPPAGADTLPKAKAKADASKSRLAGMFGGKK